MSKQTDRAALQKGLEKLSWRLKELRGFNVSIISERTDPRLEALHKSVNSTFVDIFGRGTPDYKEFAIGALDASLDNTFGDRFSSEEIQDALKTGIADAIKKVERAQKLLNQRLEGKGG